MLAQISEKIELTFWDVSISILRKASWLKWPIGHVMRILKDENLKSKIATATVIASAGFGMGMLIFFFSMVI